MRPISAPKERLELRALRLSRWVQDLLAREGRPSSAVVHSVFSRVANLRLEGGGMVSLSAPEVALAPNGVAIELPADAALGTLGVQPGRSASLHALRLQIPEADLAVSLARAACWEPRPRARRLPAGELASRARAAWAVVVAEGRAESLLPLLWVVGASGLAAPTHLVRAAWQPAARLVTAAAVLDEGSVTDACRRLAGLGPGLTPSGDDFLAGFAAAWSLGGEAAGLPQGARERVAAAILAGGSVAASDLGRVWLSHGVRGEVAEPMGRFFTALLAGAPGTLSPAIRGVLGLGATSGTDWMVGALLGSEVALAATGERRS